MTAPSTPDLPPPDGRDAEAPALVDFRALVRRLFWAAVGLASVAVVGATVHGILRGLTFTVLLQWATGFVVSLVIVSAVLLGAHAAGGMRRARRRGERLGSDDVGMTPSGSLPSWRSRNANGEDPGESPSRGQRDRTG